MRKLMIIAGIVLIAVTTQAATFKWSIANVFDGTGSSDTSSTYNGAIYLFDAGLNTQESIYGKILQKTDVAGLAITSTTVANGLVNANLRSSQFEYGDGGTKYGFYAVIIDGEKVYFSNVKEVTANTTSTAATVGLGSQNNNRTTFSATAPSGTEFAGSGRWSNVPEPTSAMLIVLGVAALALRRRRA